jgi:AcrR family transcriptional regulator
MAENNTDRRIIRTKRMIRDALSELIGEKGFDGITVTDLTIKADINRGTFYLHYRDKYDLLEQSEDEIIKEFYELAKEFNPLDIINFNMENEPLPFAVKMFEYLKENATFMKAILGSKGDPTFQIKFKDFMRVNLFEEKIVKQLNKINMLVPQEYLIAYIISAHLGVIQQWLASGMVQSPREMALILPKMTLAGPLHAAGLRNN